MIAPAPFLELRPLPPLYAAFEPAGGSLEAAICGRIDRAPRICEPEADRRLPAGPSLQSFPEAP
jgi:hypothetical protein